MNGTMEYNRFKPWKSLEPWQVEVLEEEGNIVLRSGRQVGKSTVVSILAGDFAINNPKKEILIISKVERQAYHLFFKVKNYINEKYPNAIKGRPTMTYMEFNNGAKIHCLPAGMDGEGIRGLTIDLLIADEAAFIPELVWTAISPMLAITKGKMVLLSTPHGKRGYFYDRFNDPTFKEFHVSSEDCPRRDDDFLKYERERLGKILYCQEYLGMFLDDLTQVFPDELITEAMTLKPRDTIGMGREYYLGMDLAAMGEDQSTFEILDNTKEVMEHVYHQVTTKTYPHESYQLAKELDLKYNFKKIYMDDAGLGIGTFGLLYDDTQTRRKVVGINNARKIIGRGKDGKEEKKQLMKEALYMNLRTLMHLRKIRLIKDDEIFQSLKSVQFEIRDGEVNKIFGQNTHIAEGLIRAAWGAKDKSLNIYCY